MKTKLSPFAMGIIFALMSAALFAIRPIFVKLVYAESVDSATLIFWRMLLSAPIYLVLLIWFLRRAEMRQRLNAKICLHVGFAGLIGYFGASYFDLLGLQYVTAQLGRIILYSYPTLVVILGALFTGYSITRKTLIALALTYCGIGFIFGHDLNEYGDDVITGGLWILASALLFSIYLLISKPLIKNIGSRLFTALALLSASAGIIIYYLASFPIEQAQINADAFWLILTIAIFCTVIPTFCTTAAVARIGPDKASIVAMIGPGFTSIFAVSFLGESFTVYHLFGIGLVLAGIAFLKE
jgi:drug/metabolite transporter (DMT)-like permease